MQPATMTVPAAHELERIRDIPRTCPCTYEWDEGRWHRILTLPGCPWHYQAGGR
jgi:hypothetical protein